ncbi:MAG: prepilin-type N-terminal cleavage/methylation domain-containing protein [Deltaproteobacteria bacterium]|nr:prepilin-type N-terminal cleavage/methylation domain-containing protein [Deltaproteobacteria bacterium]
MNDATGHRPYLWPRLFRPAGGFTLLEVLVAMAVLAVSLLALHQAFSSTIYVNTATNGMWKAILYSNNELARLERGNAPDVSVQQGEFPADHEMAGYTWRREVTDEEPFPGVVIRRVEYELSWVMGESTQSYRSGIYLAP